MSAHVSTTRSVSRRRFLQKTGLALAAVFPALIPARALGRAGTVAPSSRVTLGLVGAGRGWQDLLAFLPFPDVQVVAVSDVDSRRMSRVVQAVNTHYQSQSVRHHRNFREMFTRAKPDAVILAAPDHWHTIMAVSALRAGIDVYGEIPLAHTLAEGRLICDAVRRHGRVWQSGSWQRSEPDFRLAADLVGNGRLGKISNVEVGTHGGAASALEQGMSAGPGDALLPPAHLNYGAWVGPAQWTDYNPLVTHANWRFLLNYGGGMLMDGAGHYVDAALWALGLDRSGPVKISGSGTFATTPPWDVENRYRYTCIFDNGLTLTVSSEFATGVRFYGERGWIFVDREKLEASDPDLLLDVPGQEESHVYRSENHHRNFIDCVKSRRVTVAPVETAHRAASIGHLGHIAIQTGRTLQWDPLSETIKDDPGAEALLEPVYRVSERFV
ncbi:MAG: Gfo/Idh/MocA family oxidoreductase [Puniceicoccales bacterium]|jgi:predicted dehydrogenase|nr:Gfo/Idh/MocA family oxidoreductase [Puniceicoccales bacterium]